jgi:hypothetical protein
MFSHFGYEYVSNLWDAGDLYTFRQITDGLPLHVSAIYRYRPR